MKNRTEKHFDISIPDSIVVRNLGRARDSACLSSKLFLEEAKSTRDATRGKALEALAMERAIVADRLEAIARDRFGVEVGQLDTSDGREASRRENRSIRDSEKRLKWACEKLYRRCNDKTLKQYLRDLRTTLLGLTFVSDYRASATAASISM